MVFFKAVAVSTSRKKSLNKIECLSFKKELLAFVRIKLFLKTAFTLNRKDWSTTSPQHLINGEEKKKGPLAGVNNFHKDTFPLDVKVERKWFSSGRKMVFNGRQEKVSRKYASKGEKFLFYWRKLMKKKI